MQECANYHPELLNMTSSERRVCDYIRSHSNPWFDCKLGAILAQAKDGTWVLIESPCFLGYAKPSYQTYDLNRNPLGSVPSRGQPPANPWGDNCGPWNNYCLGSGGPDTGGFGGGTPGTPGPGRPVLGGVPLDLNALEGIYNLLGGRGNAGNTGAFTQAILALVFAAGGIRGSMDSLVPNLDNQFGFRLDGLADQVGQLGDHAHSGWGSLVDILTSALTPGGSPLGTALGEAIGRAAAGSADATTDQPTNAAGLVLANLKSITHELQHSGSEILGPIMGEMDTVTRDLISKMISTVIGSLEKAAPVTQDNFPDVAAIALRDALLAGLAAQTTAIVIDGLWPLHYLGLGQAAGLIAEFAGFGEIAKPVFRPTLHYAIELPAQQRAAYKFRTVLPDHHRAKELAAEGYIPVEDYVQTLYMHGLPTWWAAKEVEDLYRHLRPVDLARALENSEVEPAWVVTKLRQDGISPEDAAILEKALELKATKSGRDRLAGAGLAEFKAGHIDPDTLDAVLTGAGFSATHRKYWRRTAELERRGSIMDRVASEVIRQHVNNLLSKDETTQMLTALGFTDGEVSTRVLTAELRREEKALGKVEAQVEGQLRKLQTQGLKLATRAVRAGFIDGAQYLAYANSYGFSTAYAEAALEIAVLQGPPGRNTGELAIGTGALNDTRDEVAALLHEQVAAGQVARVAALGILLELGMPHDLASLLVDLAEALGPSHPTGLGLLTPSKDSLENGFQLIAKTLLDGLAGGRGLPAILEEIIGRLGIRGLGRPEIQGLINNLKRLIRGL
jgi:hypothetical protein